MTNFNLDKKETVESFPEVYCYPLYRYFRLLNPKLTADDFVNQNLNFSLYGRTINFNAYVQTPFGKRILFYCPMCNKPVEKLYLTRGNGSYGCAKCHDLTYTSRQEHGGNPKMVNLWRDIKTYLSFSDKKSVASMKNRYKYLHRKAREKEIKEQTQRVLEQIMNQ